MPKQVRRKWTPHAGQLPIIQSAARFRVCPCGRRFGKTEMAQYETADFALEQPGTLVWWISPSYDDANELGYLPIKRILESIDMVADFRRQKPRYIELPNGSRISFRSADRPESLQGRGVDFITVDEAGDVSGETYRAEIRPSITDTGGDVLLIGTPTGRNYFQDLAERGKDGANPNIETFQRTSYQNPHVPDYEIDAARDELPERVFEREYLAKFAEAEGAVFPGVWDRNCVTYDLSSYQGTSPYYTGVDLGRQKNFSAISVLDSTGKLSHFDRIRRVSWNIIENRVKRVATNYAPSFIRMDASRDNQIIENIDSAVRSATVEYVKFGGGKTKNNLIENLSARLELGDIQLPDSGEELEIILRELEAYQYDTTKAGNVRYGPPSGTHDDAVDSLALAAKPPESKENSGTWGRSAGRSAAGNNRSGTF